MLGITLSLKNGKNLVVIIFIICQLENYLRLRVGHKSSKEDKIRYAKTYISGEGLWSPDDENFE